MTYFLSYSLCTKTVGKDINWTNWFAAETDQGLCGVEDNFVNLASSYLEKVDILEKLLETSVRKEFWSSLDQAKLSVSITTVF